MERYIVDASVGVKWFFNEESSDIARHLVRQLETKKIHVVVPDLFYHEMANTFWHRIQKRQIRVATALYEFDALTNFQLDQYPGHELSDVALENAIQLGVSVYDAIYISLAEIYVAPLVTADEFLIKACRNKFDFILPLREFK